MVKATSHYFAYDIHLNDSMELVDNIVCSFSASLAIFANFEPKAFLRSVNIRNIKRHLVNSRNHQISILAIALVTLLPALSFGQPQTPSIHQLEHLRYQDQEFDQEVPGLPRAQVPLAPRDTIRKEVFGFHPYWMGIAWEDYQFSLLTTIAYFGVEVSATGDITNYRGWPVQTLIARAHTEGVRVVLTAILFDSDAIRTLLGSGANRSNLIENLLTAVQNAAADGVNIDFEGVPGSQRQNLTTFMQELTATFHDQLPGSHVSIDVPAVDWGDAFDEEQLARTADALFIMGYDYHWKNSKTTGPVSPLTGWNGLNLTSTVNVYLKNTNSNRKKLILGLPYYGYKWLATGSNAGASIATYDTSLTYAAAEPEALAFGKLRDVSGGEIPWYRYSSGESWYQTWYDDSLSLSLKYEYANQAGLRGVGIWALGYDGDRPELWGALANYLEKEIPEIDTTSGLQLAAFPNPFHGSVSIRYTVPENYNSQISLAVYDLQGRRMASYFDDQWVLASGTVRWDGRNEAGRQVASGIYLVVGRDYFRTQTVKITYLP